MLSFNELQLIRSFLTVSNGLLLTITDRTEIFMPKRIQLRRSKGWRLPADAVKVSRQGKWAVNGSNVVVDGKHQDGSLSGPVSIVVNGNAEMVITSLGSVQLMGSVGEVKTMSGNVRTRGDILGSVNTM